MANSPAVNFVKPWNGFSRRADPREFEVWLKTESDKLASLYKSGHISQTEFMDGIDVLLQTSMRVIQGFREHMPE